MKDYYNLFIQLSLQQCTKKDYADKAKVKLHNKSYKQLLKLQEEMTQIDCLNVLKDLLKHNDDRVKINAASLCFKMNFCVEDAISTLNDIIVNTRDSTMCFSAKMVLLQSGGRQQSGNGSMI